MAEPLPDPDDAPDLDHASDLDEPGRHRPGGTALRPAGPVADPDDTWADENPPWSPPPTVRGVHSGQSRHLLVGTIGLVAVIVGAGILLWLEPHRTADLSAALPSASATTVEATTTAPAPPPAAPTTRKTTTTVRKSTPQWTTLTVSATKVWRRGDVVKTNRTKLELQTNGDFVIIDEFGKTRWHSNTAGRGITAVFQNDGHLVVYDWSLRSVWSSGTEGHNGAVLVLAADGNVNIVDHGTVIWSSHTAH